MPLSTENDEPQLPFFIYGTLLQGEANSHLLKKGIVGSARAYLEGAQLFDLGPYPMLVWGDGSVWGEVVVIDPLHYARVRSALDRLEGVRSDAPLQAGGLYHRCRVTVDVGGRAQEAWTYIGKEEVARRGRLIQSGDWKRRFQKSTWSHSSSS